MSFSINLYKNPEESIKELMQECIDLCRKALQEYAHPHEAIHTTRKELKKIRAICRLVRDEIGKEAHRAANKFLRNTARRLSDARDTSAMLETLSKLAQNVTDQKQQMLLNSIKNHLRAKKAAITRVQINRQQLLKAVSEDLKNAEQYFSGWSFQHHDFSVFRPNIQRVYKRCRKGFKNAYQEGTPQAFHEWRKRVKYLRYQIKMLVPVWPGPMTVWEEELHQLTDYLGEDHDLTVLLEYAAKTELASDPNMEALTGQIAALKHTCQIQAKPLGQKLFSLKPAQFSDVMASWWSSQSESSVSAKEKWVLA